MMHKKIRRYSKELCPLIRSTIDSFFIQIIEFCVFCRPDLGQFLSIFDFKHWLVQTLCSNYIMYTYNVVLNPKLPMGYYLGYFEPN